MESCGHVIFFFLYIISYFQKLTLKGSSFFFQPHPNSYLSIVVPQASETLGGVVGLSSFLYITGDQTFVSKILQAYQHELSPKHSFFCTFTTETESWSTDIPTYRDPISNQPDQTGLVEKEYIIWQKTHHFREIQSS